MNDLKQKHDLIESTIRYIRYLNATIDEEIPKYRMGSITNVEDILKILEGINDIFRSTILTADITGIQNDESKENLLGFLEDLNEAISNQDTIFIADILEYEILPILNDWRKELIVAYKKGRANFESE